MINLLYITFGENVFIHSQAAFSICTFLKQKQHVNSINIITDAPDYYKFLGDHVNVIVADHVQLKKWRGPHDFFWRIKIKAIEMICEKYPDQPVVYLDTDTFLYQKNDVLHSALSQKIALMHLDEGALSLAKSKTEKKMWKQVSGKLFGGLQIPRDAHMWNAGVVGTPNNKNLEDLKLAVKICDDMCAAGVTRRLVEQFALSVALSHYYKMNSAEDFIAHYWSNKDEWNKTITNFFAESFFRNLSVEQMIQSIDQFNFKSVAVARREKNTAIRLHKVVDKLFKNKGETFISH